MNIQWSLKMTWRESRSGISRLLLVLSSMILGVAALVAINSFGENLERTADQEAKALLGADLAFSANQPFTVRIEAIVDSLIESHGGEQSRRVSFTSMGYFPQSDEARLATVRANEGTYPFYGSIDTTPPGGAETYLDNHAALVDVNLMRQLDAEPGDSVRIGRATYVIAGSLDRTPRESAAQAIFSPRIFIPESGIDTTLLGRGSRASYEVFIRFDGQPDVAAMLEPIRDELHANGVGVETVDSAREAWGGVLGNLYRFLGLVGFIALLLGGLGIASAVNVYIRRRIDTIAILRCLGASGRDSFRIYLVQAALMGLVAATLGSVLGVGIQMLMPFVLSDFLPFDVELSIAWGAILVGMGVGVGVTVIFAFLPLIGIRRISPMRTLRSSIESPESGWTDPLRWLAYGLIAAGVTVFAITQAPNNVVGVSYAAGIGLVFLLLALVARLIAGGARRLLPAGYSYTFRQGLANLYRPQNQTLTLMLAMGLGTFLILTLYLSQQTLLNRIELVGGEGRPNTVLFDVQTDQLPGVTELVRSQGRSVIDEVPIVSMRLAEVKGRSVDEIRADTARQGSTWAFTREYRSTYRDHLVDSERVTAGAFHGSVQEDAAAAPVSVEEGLAEQLGVGLQDTLLFDVHGVRVTTVVASLREVDWQRVSTNFFVVFPPGVLEDAPQFHVVLTRTQDDEESAALQRAVFQQFPTVSIIDLTLVLGVVEELSSRISLVIRFMAIFSILTGIIVLTGALMVSRLQRIQETVLLKTLGASRKQVCRILMFEYTLLGTFAALTGVLLSLAAGWGLARFVFDAPFSIPVFVTLGIIAAVVGLTLLIGSLTSRGVYNRTPLEVLRAEG